MELAVVIFHPDGTVDERERRFNPEMPIPAEASRVHGITDADVAHEAPFHRRAKALAQLLGPCDLAGFNMRSFDLPMLAAEFERAGVEFDVTNRRLVDVQQIFHRQEPRDLSAAVRFYLERDHGDAHTALSDTRAPPPCSRPSCPVRRPAAGHGGLHAYCDQVRPYRSAFDRWFEQTGHGLRFRRGKHRASCCPMWLGPTPTTLSGCFRPKTCPARCSTP